MGLQVTITTSKISTKLQTQVYHMKTCHRWIQAHIVSTGQSPDKFRNLTIYANKNQGGFVFSGNISGSIRLVIYIYIYICVWYFSDVYTGRSLQVHNTDTHLHPAVLMNHELVYGYKKKKIIT